MIITFANIKGGAGKTTNAVHIGSALAARGRAVLVLDTDRQASAWRWARMADAAGEPLPLVVEHMATEHFVQRLAEFDSTYDDVLIDVGPGDGNIMTEAMRRSELVVIPINARPDDQQQAVKAAAQCKRDGVPHVALLSRVRMSEKTSIRTAVAYLTSESVPVLELVIPDLTEIGHSFGGRVSERMLGYYGDVLDQLQAQQQLQEEASV